jgi:ubiquinone/menaquinone biosynthesis C-methylase UbiE
MKKKIFKYFYLISKIMTSLFKNILIEENSHLSNEFYKNLYKYNRFFDNNERISKTLFLKKNIKNFKFLNNDSFLDVGCGNANNLKFIKKNLKKSKLYGCDINERYKVTNQKFKFNFKLIDLKKINSLNVYKTKSIDHVYMIHTLNHIFSNNISNTTILRKNIIENMIRIAKKNIFIIENKSFIGCNDLNNEIYFQNRSLNKIELNYNLRTIINKKISSVTVYFTDTKTLVYQLNIH